MYAMDMMFIYRELKTESPNTGSKYASPKPRKFHFREGGP